MVKQLNNNKKTILWSSEASFMNTGFSVLSYEILKRLYATDKYNIVEYGSYAKTTDPRAQELPWDFYGGIPEDNDQFGLNRYNSSVYGQFGEALFEQVCLQCQPDYLVSSRDQWMSSAWELKSPFRKYVKYILMPTVDGEPQRIEWLDDYSRADTLLTYSQYGKETLEREAPGQINVKGVVRPGVNQEIYCPMDKDSVRKQLGIPIDANIILTIMRNQRRKLFPDMMDIFAEYLKRLTANGEKEKAQKTYLYLHTSYPDVGFDIQKHLIRTGIGHKVFMTYCCSNCGAYYASNFSGEVVVCKKCRQKAAHLPNTQQGLTREQLAIVTNVADLYLQLSICEGLGMPIAEAKACGIPAMAMTYSASAEQVECEGCIPLKVGKFFYEPVIETEQKRALPDEEDTINKITDFFNLSKDKQKQMGAIARKDAIENYSFDRAAKVFEEAIDLTPSLNQKETWLYPKGRFAPMTQEVPNNLSNSDFIDYLIDNILGEPQLKHAFCRTQWVQGLNSGCLVERGGKSVFDRKTAANTILNLAKNKNFWEEHRLQHLIPQSIVKTKSDDIQFTTV